MLREYSDVDRNPLAIGDRVVAVGDDSPVVSRQEGVIVSFENGIGVDWDVEQDDRYHNLHRHISTNTGRWHGGNQLRRIAQPIEEEFEASLAGVGNYLTFGSQVYELIPQQLATPSEVLTKRDGILTARYRAACGQLRTKEEELQQKAQELTAMPNINIDHIHNGLRCYRDRQDIHYLLPFLYAPQIIIYSDAPYKLKPEHCKQLRREVVMDMAVNQIGNFNLRLLKPQIYEIFEHYHFNRVWDCLGEFSLRATRVGSIADVFAIRDAYQSLLQTVNSDSPGMNRPSGLLQLETLIRSRQPLEGDDVLWTARGRGSGQEGQIVVGSLVKVIGITGAFPQEGIGAIGKVVAVSSDGQVFGVEFLFSNGHFHSCDGFARQGYGHNIYADHLELTPSGARRTRSLRISSPAMPYLPPPILTTTGIRDTSEWRS